MKILAGAVNKTDLEDKNKDVKKDPDKKDFIIDMGATVTPEIMKSSKHIQEVTTNKKNQETILDKFLKGFAILTVVTSMACGISQYLRWRSEQTL